MAIDKITVTRAQVHNLKNVSVTLPKNQITVMTGPSGSGKSSLAFDTIYMEGQRRYIESLSSYARQFLGQFQPPEVESITGLSPAIAIDQKTSSRNPRSTVGTITEIYDYLRVLFARAGTLYCLESKEEVKKFSPSQIVNQISKSPERSKIYLMAPLNFKSFSERDENLRKFLSMGFIRYRFSDEIHSLESINEIKNNKSLNVDVVIDRLVIKNGVEKRLTDSVEYALKISGGDICVLIDDKEFFYSEKNMAPKSKKVYPDLEPRLFSFNSPLGACPKCNGIGQSKSFDIDRVILDENLSIESGALPPLKKGNNFLMNMVKSFAKEKKVDLKKPYKSYPESFKKTLLYGSNEKSKFVFSTESSHFEFTKKFPGVLTWLEKKYHESTTERVRK